MENWKRFLELSEGVTNINNRYVRTDKISKYIIQLEKSDDPDFPWKVTIHNLAPKKGIRGWLESRVEGEELYRTESAAQKDYQYKLKILKKIAPIEIPTSTEPTFEANK